MKKKELCQNCRKREATVDWIGDGGTLAFSHGMYQRWCEYCCTDKQLQHAKKLASMIPELEQKLKTL